MAKLNVINLKGEKTSDIKLNVGEIVKVKIEEADIYDLRGVKL